MDKNSAKQRIKNEVDSNRCKTNKRQRRIAAGKVCSDLERMFGPKTVYGGVGETKLNIMSNADRRSRGFEEDEDLEDYQGKKT